MSSALKRLGFLHTTPSLLLAGRKPTGPITLERGSGLNSGLRGRWPINETFGSVCRDYVARNHINLVGASLSRAGISFDSDDYGTVSQSAALDFGTGSFSVCAWIDHSGPLDEAKRLFYKSGGALSASEPGWSIYYDTSSKAFGRIQISDGSTIVTASPSGGTTLNSGKLFLCVVFDRRDGEAIIYVDGSPQNSNIDISSVTGSTDNSGDLVFGRYPPLDIQHFIGDMENISIYARALKSPEILKIYRDGYAGFKSANDVPFFVVPSAAGNTGTGSLDAQQSALASEASTTYQATGALDSKSATILAAGIGEYSGVAALDATQATISAIGVTAVTRTGSAALDSQASTISAAAISEYASAGALASEVATLAGAGLSSSTRTGAAALDSQSAAISAAGVTLYSAAGTLESAQATIAGAGILVAPRTGTAALISQPATIAATGILSLAGAGALDASQAELLGAGLAINPRTGAALLSAQVATIAGEGAALSPATATGALNAAAAIIAGQSARLTISERLYTALAGFSGLTDIVGLRIRPVDGGQAETSPYLVYEILAVDPFNTLSDFTGDGLRRTEFELVAWSRTHKQARQIFEQTLNALRTAADFNFVFLGSDDGFDTKKHLYSASAEIAIWK